MAPTSNTSSWGSGSVKNYLNIFVNYSLILDVHISRAYALNDDISRLGDCVNYHRRNGWLFYSWQ